MDPSLETQSWMRRWWLESVHGYKVLEVRRRPHPGWFGSVSIRESYVMLPRESSERVN